MQTKLILAVLALQVACSAGAELRKIPKLYNALITTDENLTSSRTYPVIQPTLHEYGVSYPYGYHPVDYRALRGPAIYPQYQVPFARPNIFFPPQYMQRPLEPAPQPYEPTATPAPMPEKVEQTPPTAADAAATAQNEIKTDDAAANKQTPEAPTAQPALPADKQFLRGFYALPPQAHGNFNPYHLPPMPYQPYPVVYNPYNRQREFFLPPYNYLPNSQVYAKRTPQAAYGPAAPEQPSAAAQPDLTPAPANAAPAEPLGNNFDSIKNGSPNKASNIPDVPPPPLPSGGAKAQDTLAQETAQPTPATAAASSAEAAEHAADTLAAQ